MSPDDGSSLGLEVSRDFPRASWAFSEPRLSGAHGPTPAAGGRTASRRLISLSGVAGRRRQMQAAESPGIPGRFIVRDNGGMLLHLASTAWHAVAGRLQWRLLRLVHSTFLVSVSGVITQSGTDVLLVRHRFWPDGTWGLPGGYLRSSESLTGALVREVKEETGLVIAIDELLQVRGVFDSGSRFRTARMLPVGRSWPTAARFWMLASSK